MNQELAERYCSGLLSSNSPEYRALLKDYHERGDDSVLGRFAADVQARAIEQEKVPIDLREVYLALVQLEATEEDLSESSESSEPNGDVQSNPISFWRLWTRLAVYFFATFALAFGLVPLIFIFTKSTDSIPGIASPIAWGWLGNDGLKIGDSRESIEERASESQLPALANDTSHSNRGDSKPTLESLRSSQVDLNPNPREQVNSDEVDVLIDALEKKMSLQEARADNLTAELHLIAAELHLIAAELHSRAIALISVLAVMPLLGLLIANDIKFTIGRNPSNVGGFLDGVAGYLVGCLLGSYIGMLLGIVQSYLWFDQTVALSALVTGLAGSTFGLLYGGAIRRFYAGRECSSGELFLYFLLTAIPLAPVIIRNIIDSRYQPEMLHPVYFGLGITLGLILRLLITGFQNKLVAFSTSEGLRWLGVTIILGFVAGAFAKWYHSELEPVAQWDLILRWIGVAICIPASIPIAKTFSRTWGLLSDSSSNLKWKSSRRFLRVVWLSVFVVPVASGIGVGFTDVITAIVEYRVRRSSVRKELDGNKPGPELA